MVASRCPVDSICPNRRQLAILRILLAWYGNLASFQLLKNSVAADFCILRDCGSLTDCVTVNCSKFLRILQCVNIGASMS